MDFTSPELSTKSNPKTCSRCGSHVNNARAVSWETGWCTSCYHNTKIKKEIDDSNPLDTIVNRIIVNPMTVYLNQYTPSEMRNMK